MYLTVMMVSRPLLACNNRGENVGNIQTLQKITTASGARSVLSGFTLKRAIRDRMQAEGASMWRRSVESSPDNPPGYLYGPDGSPVMKTAKPSHPDAYDDTALFGYMVQAKGDSESTRSRGRVEMTAALSTTVWTGDQGFAQGANASEAQLAPFSYERHFTRYIWAFSADLDGLSKRLGALSRMVGTLSHLRVGGGHGAHASELIPALLAWRVHREPGLGGLYPGLVDVPVEGDVSVSLFTRRWNDLGIEPKVAGLGTGVPLAEGLAQILIDSKLPVLP